jgi:Ca2+-binding RTX toxin-like protein
MVGGDGDDHYYIDSASDVIVENGSYYYDDDTVESSIDYVLGSSLEYLILVGGAVSGTGNVSDNYLIGNDRVNSLYGGSGQDSLFGGLGADVLDCGLDTDTDKFIYTEVAQSTSASYDRLVNFSSYDYIDMSGVDADATASGNQYFNFIGSAEFSGVAGQLRTVTGLTNTYVYADTDGDKVADFMLQVDGLHALTSYDFYL